MSEKKDYIGEELRKERVDQQQKYAQQVDAVTVQHGQNLQNAQAVMQAAQSSWVPEYILLRAKVAELKDQLAEAVAAEREACAEVAAAKMQVVTIGKRGLSDDGRMISMADARSWVRDVLRMTSAEIRARGAK